MDTVELQILQYIDFVSFSWYETTVHIFLVLKDEIESGIKTLVLLVLDLTCSMVLDSAGGAGTGEGVSGILLSNGEGTELWDSWLAGCSGDRASLLSSSNTLG